MNVFYIPCPDLDSARTIAKACLKERLVGCANIIPQMESHYLWEGQLESSQEVLLILKTNSAPELLDRLKERIKSLHPYQIPCLMSCKPESINSPYRDWLYSNLSLPANTKESL